MSDIKLNRKRPYGVAYNHPEISFVQDGHNFRNDGSLIEVLGAPPPPTVTAGPTEEEIAADRNRRRAEAMRIMWAKRKEAAK